MSDIQDRMNGRELIEYDSIEQRDYRYDDYIVGDNRGLPDLSMEEVGNIHDPRFIYVGSPGDDIPDEILEEDVDVLAPCALGGVLNERTIPRIKAKIVCGAANNQLGTDLDDARLADRGILYMPDYLVNAGGVIVGAAAALDGVQDADELSARVARIAETAERVIEKSERENIGTARAADRLAEKIIAEKKRQ